MSAPEPDRLIGSVRKRIRRLKHAHHEDKPSVSRQIGQIGVLGWMIVVPMLLGLLLGRWIDHHFGLGIVASGALLGVGAVFGFWSAWRWMHEP